jgi:hypothetical protein
VDYQAATIGAVEQQLGRAGSTAVASQPLRDLVGQGRRAADVEEPVEDAVSGDAGLVWLPVVVEADEAEATFRRGQRRTAPGRRGRFRAEG